MQHEEPVVVSVVALAEAEAAMGLLRADDGDSVSELLGISS